jgi:hypothetical protein
LYTLRYEAGCVGYQDGFRIGWRAADVVRQGCCASAATPCSRYPTDLFSGNVLTVGALHARASAPADDHVGGAAAAAPSPVLPGFSFDAPYGALSSATGAAKLWSAPTGDREQAILMASAEWLHPTYHGATAGIGSNAPYGAVAAYRVGRDGRASRGLADGFRRVEPLPPYKARPGA